MVVTTGIGFGVNQIVSSSANPECYSAGSSLLKPPSVAGLDKTSKILAPSALCSPPTLPGTFSHLINLHVKF